MSSALNIKVSEEKGVSILHLEGPIDANTQKDLEGKAEEVISSGANNMVLDLKDVSFMGSAGFRALHVIANKLTGESQSEKFAHIKLLNPKDEVRRVIKTLGFDEYIGVYDNLDQAISSF